MLSADGRVVRVNREFTQIFGFTPQETLGRCEAVALRRSENDAITHRLNVEKVYADLGGDANPDEVGFVRAWKEAVRG